MTQGNTFHKHTRAHKKGRQKHRHTIFLSHTHTGMITDTHTHTHTHTGMITDRNPFQHTTKCTGKTIDQLHTDQSMLFWHRVHMSQDALQHTPGSAAPFPSAQLQPQDLEPYFPRANIEQTSCLCSGVLPWRGAHWEWRVFTKSLSGKPK